MNQINFDHPRIFYVPAEALDGIDSSSFEYTDWKDVQPRFFNQLADQLPSGFLLYIGETESDTYCWWIDSE